MGLFKMNEYKKEDKIMPSYVNKPLKLNKIGG